MSVKKILVPLSGQHDPEDPAALDRPALETALILAHRMNAHVEAFCVEAKSARPSGGLKPWLPPTGVEQVLKMIEEESEKRRHRVRAVFEATVAHYNPPQVTEPDPGVGYSVNFVEQVDEADGSLAARGRLADLIVTAKEAPDPDGVHSLLQTALRETGRPMLISPSTSPRKIGHRIAIAWDGSSEAARAVALSKDLWEDAEEILIISVKEDGVTEPSGDDLGAYLRWFGFDAKVVLVKGSASSAGEILLEQADKAEADMIIMGAYTRSPIRRFIFGGATDAVLAHAKMPILMVD